MKNSSKSLKDRLKAVVRGTFLGKILRRLVSILRVIKKYLAFWVRKLNKGPIRATRLLKFQIDRDTAFKDMNSNISLMENRILCYLKPFLNEKTNLDDCPVEKNVFVFWWDGLEKAPRIVKKCFNSVCKQHPDFNVIGIDKNNYHKFTDIDAKIIKDFEKDKISVQTFSDILRFNLLKNNGGIWIDSTIMFLSKLNLIEDLTDKSFTSLEFSTSRDFFKYEDWKCSWSGFFIASRKNGLFVRAVDEIFKQYYLKYKTYSIYFFIDTVLMICKKYGLEDNVLDKTLKTSNNMFTLAGLLDKEYDSDVIEIIKDTPQKLRWNIDSVNKDNTFYGWLLKE